MTNKECPSTVGWMLSKFSLFESRMGKKIRMHKRKWNWFGRVVVYNIEAGLDGMECAEEGRMENKMKEGKCRGWVEGENWPYKLANKQQFIGKNHLFPSHLHFFQLDIFLPFCL
jgi:hypothetical protein